VTSPLFIYLFIYLLGKL